MGRLMCLTSVNGCQMQAPIDAKVALDLHVIEGLIKRLAWSYNSGGLELVRSDISRLASVLDKASREPAVSVVDEWLSDQVQRGA